MNVLQKFEARQVASAAKAMPEFSPGDTVIVNVKIKEGTRERIQAFEGVCIARAGKAGDVNASFTVRKISLGEGVERVFPLYSPTVDSIELVRRGSVRRAKLYYLRDLRGKGARISERTSGHGFDTAEEQDVEEMTQTAKRAAKKTERNEKRAEGRKVADARKADKAAAKKAAKDAKAAEASAAANPPAEEPKA